MFESLGKFIGRKPPQKGPPLVPETPSSPARSSQGDSRGDRKQTYSKIFRWRLPDGQTEEPSLVEIVGSFTQWKRVTLLRDGKQDSWHAMIHHIEGNRTHHYMLLLDGKPTHDKTCDGLAVPHGYQEEQYQLMTDKGPRVFMLFGQAK
jgi:hypothetical protein